MTFARTLALETLTKSDFSFQVIFLFLSFAPTATATAVQLMVADAISKTWETNRDRHWYNYTYGTVVDDAEDGWVCNCYCCCSNLPVSINFLCSRCCFKLLKQHLLLFSKTPLSFWLIKDLKCRVVFQKFNLVWERKATLHHNMNKHYWLTEKSYLKALKRELYCAVCGMQQQQSQSAIANCQDAISPRILFFGLFLLQTLRYPLM